MAMDYVQMNGAMSVTELGRGRSAAAKDAEEEIVTTVAKGF